MSDEVGRCLCGAITIRGEVDPDMLACHCNQCQCWTGGGPLLSVSVSNLEVSGGESVAAYHASAWGERCFCATCGATLYWELQGQPIRSVAAGLLDDQSRLRVTHEIYVDQRPPWLAPFEGATQSTEAEELAKRENQLASLKN